MLVLTTYRLIETYKIDYFTLKELDHVNSKIFF